MSLSLEELRSAALSLPLGERLHLLDALHESVGPGLEPEGAPFESAAAFEAEMDQRMKAYVSGEEPGIAWEDVQKEAHAVLREP